MRLLDMLELPMCARCKRHVDDVVMDKDIRSREYIFTAVCHGEREEVRVPFTMVEAAVASPHGGLMQLGLAFKPPLTAATRGPMLSICPPQRRRT